MSRWAWADVDTSAIAHNLEVVRRLVAPTQVWAVVKADGYGHGAVAVSNAALSAGASGLCVALVDEGASLRAAGIDAPIQVFSEQPPSDVARAVQLGLECTVASRSAIEAIEATGAVGHRVHLEIDTGMRRVGCRPDEAVDLARRIVASPACELASTFTHFAVADEPGDPFTARQLDTYLTAIDAIRAAGIDPGDRHAANSAGAIAHPAARLDRVRVGIAMYGIAPGPGLDPGLRPAMRLAARVSFVKRVRAGDRISYGLRHTFDRDTLVATVPIGYADGVPRRWGRGGTCVGGEVLIGGRRCPVVGVVTMDQLMVDVGTETGTDIGTDIGTETDDRGVCVGDEVVVIGRQGDAELRAEEIAERLGTIGYEIVCAVSARVPRRHGVTVARP